jgi:hypothetical protein
MRALFRPFSAGVATSRKNHRLQTIDRGSPEFAQERDNRSKKAKFIFREIGSIRATRLSPRRRPAALSRSSSRLRLWHVCRMNIPCRRSWPWLPGLLSRIR